MAKNAGDNQEDNQEEDGARNELAEISQALIEGGLFRMCGEASCIYRQRPSERRSPRPLRWPFRSPTEVPRKTMLRASALVEAGSPVASFSHGSDSPVSAALLDIEVARNQESRVGGNQIPCRKPDDVSRHNVAPLYFLPLSAAEDGGCGGNLIAQSFRWPVENDTSELSRLQRSAEQ